MRKSLAASLLAVSAVIAASPPSPANADPEDLVPWCTADQTPADNNCRPSEDQGYSDSGPGANPEQPTGVNPGAAPIV